MQVAYRKFSRFCIKRYICFCITGSYAEQFVFLLDHPVEELQSALVLDQFLEETNI